MERKKDHTRTEVSELPNCDICGKPAYADANTRARGIMGPWANLCKTHFAYFGCELGLGKGQELVMKRAD